ncbi:MAG: Hsp70 family protein [Phycisphaeraceae bacterium]
MKDRPVYFGIDLGTSNCSVAYVVPTTRKSIGLQAQTVPFLVDRAKTVRSCRLPSVVCRKNNEKSAGKALFGFEAENANNRFTHGGDIFRSTKSHLGTLRSYMHAYIDQLNTPVKAWAALISHLCDEVKQSTPDHLDPRDHLTVLTVPASFSVQQRQDTLDAAQRAGLRPENIRLIDEPVAALIDWLSTSQPDLSICTEGWTNLLVMDYGGGTCDLSLVALRQAEGSPMDMEVKNLAISPYHLLGGDTIDTAIMVEIWNQIEDLTSINCADLTARERRLVEEANRLTCRRLKERICEALGKLDPQDRRQQKWGRMSVSELLAKGVTVADGKRIAGRVVLTADAFRDIMAPFLNPDGAPFPVTESVMGLPCMGLLGDTLARADMAPADLHVILLHGGSCKNPLVRDAMEDFVGAATLFGNCRITQTPDLDTSVARGAALHGYYLGHQDRWVVRPIVAEDLGIVTTGDVPQVLVPAGTPLPFPELGWHEIANSFFIASEGQKRMLVPIFTGQVLSGEFPRIAISKLFDLPPGLPQSHPIQVNLRIDENKVVQCQFRPGGSTTWMEPWSISDPWIYVKPNNELETLRTTRAQIRDHLDHGRAVPLSLQNTEAHHALCAGDSQDALVLIEDVLTTELASAEAWNIKGLIHGRRGEAQACARCHEEAARLAPGRPVYRGNYGAALVNLGQHERAVVEMRAALSEDSSLRYLHSWLASAFEHLGQLEEARKELQRWLEAAQQMTVQYPEYAPAWRDLEMVCRRMGLYDQADEAQHRSMQLLRTRYYGGSPEELLAGKAHG